MDIETGGISLHHAKYSVDDQWKFKGAADHIPDDVQNNNQCDESDENLHVTILDTDMGVPQVAQPGTCVRRTCSLTGIPANARYAWYQVILLPSREQAAPTPPWVREGSFGGAR
ncbi:MAG: hypothetical protein LAO21_13190 [Acidobacteriia bacterium]|nr:hypothetical protein [Terriglobia bacterium]